MMMMMRVVPKKVRGDESRKESGGCDGAGVGDGDGEGERSIGENGEDSGGGVEADEKGDGVLPYREKLEPVASRD
jgi:hypothetical protein